MGKYVLVVDDDPDIQELIADILASMDIDARKVADGHAALQMTRVERPLAVVLDLMMPLVDGYAFIHETQEDPALKQVPIIVYSAYVDEAEPRLLNEPNVIGVLSKGKPSSGKLLNLLRTATQGAGA